MSDGTSESRADQGDGVERYHKGRTETHLSREITLHEWLLSGAWDWAGRLKG